MTTTPSNQVTREQPSSGDLVERLQEESLQLARRSFDSCDAGISANLCDEAIDEITSLKEEIIVLQARGDLSVQNRNSWQEEAERRDARIAELEANEKAYEEIIGPMTYRELTDRALDLEAALIEVSVVLSDALRTINSVLDPTGTK